MYVRMTDMSQGGEPENQMGHPHIRVGYIAEGRREAGPLHSGNWKPVEGPLAMGRSPTYGLGLEGLLGPADGSCRIDACPRRFVTPAKQGDESAPEAPRKKRQGS